MKDFIIDQLVTGKSLTYKQARNKANYYLEAYIAGKKLNPFPPPSINE